MEYQVNEIDQEQVAKIQENVRVGLRLDEHFPDWDRGYQERTLHDIAESVVELGEILEINVDELEFRADDLPGSTSGQLIQRQTDGSTRWIVSLSKRLLRVRNPLVPQELVDSARDYTLAHELYHRREAQRFPQHYERSVAAGESEDESVYKNDRGEEAANLFSIAYIKKRNKRDLKQLAADLAINYMAVRLTKR